MTATSLHPRSRLVDAALRRASTRPFTFRDAIRLGDALLTKAGVSCHHSVGTTRLESTFLVYWAAGLRRFDPARLDTQVPPGVLVDALTLIERRIKTRRPAAHLTGEAYFRGRWFVVNADTFVPRTPMASCFEEVLAEGLDTERALDLGCGCGSNGILLALARPSLSVDLADISPAALRAARANVARYGLGDRVRCVQSDLFAGVAGPYSLIVANLPYVATADVDQRTPDARCEPRVAWDGGADGLDLVVRLLRDAPRHLTPSGTLLLDVGPQNRKALTERFPDLLFRWWRDDRGDPTGVLSMREPTNPMEE